MIITSTTNPSVHVVKRLYTYFYVNILCILFIYLYIYFFISLTLQEAKKVAFMAFVGVCIIFQAIISDVYVYNKKAVTSSPTLSPTSSPAPITPNGSLSISR